MGLYHPLDGNTNLKYRLLCFLAPNKKNSERKALAFNWDRCCHLALCLRLILFHYAHRFMLQIVMSLTIVIYNCKVFIGQATGGYFCLPFFFVRQFSISTNFETFSNFFNEKKTFKLFPPIGPPKLSFMSF
jgi:hypothetical protein